METSEPSRFTFSFSQRDQQLFIRRFNHSFRAVEELGFKDQDRIVVAHRGLQQAFCVARRSRCANLQARKIRIETFGRMRMSRAELVRGAVRPAKRDRNIKLTARHGEHVWRVVNHLIECHQGETEWLPGGHGRRRLRGG